MTMFRTILVGAALVAGLAGDAAAQTIIQAPPALEENDPRGPVAMGLVTALLAGDQKAAEAYVAKHGASGYAADQAKADLAGVIEKLTGHELVLLRQGPDGAVLAPMRKKGGDMPVAVLIVGMEAAAPHRITGMQVRPLQISAGD